MKKSALMLTLLFAVSCVNAENLFQNNNPFPQTTPQTMNNIYESEPAVMQEEQKQAKKSWFRRNKKEVQQIDTSDYVVPQSRVINEGVNDGSFYVFK